MDTAIGAGHPTKSRDRAAIPALDLHASLKELLADYRSKLEP
jgi:hypothetical protein